MRRASIGAGAIWAALSLAAWGQQQAPKVIPPPGFGPRVQAGTAQPAKPSTPPPAAAQKPVPAAPQPGQTPQQPAQQAAQPPPAPRVTSTASGGFFLNVQNAPLAEVIAILAERLKINYILDPRVKGSVTINTFGEIRQVEVRPLLETILRINGMAMVQVGELYRIVPVNEVGSLPIPPQVDVKTFPDDERMMMNLVFLKYATVGELANLLKPFLGEGARMVTYDPANLLILLDNSRNMKRTMELIAMFDSDTLAGQRVHLLEVKNSRPSDLAKELESVMKAVTLADKASAVRFLPIDRINTIVAIAPNPGVFAQVETWLKKLDVKVKNKAGSMENYVYRVKYGRAETLAMAIMSLYGGYGMGGYGMGGYGMGGYGMGGYGMGGYGMGGYGMGGMGGYGMGGYGMGGYGMGGYGMGGYGMGGYGMGVPQGNVTYGPPVGAAAQPLGTGGAAGGTGAATTGSSTATGTSDLTGSYLGSGGYGYGSAAWGRIPHIVPNPLDNSLLIQATAQEYEQILKLLQELDVSPRQVLIEAKIFEVNLSGDFSSGVSAVLQKKGTAASRQFTGSFNTSGNAGIDLTAGMLVGHSRELLAFLTAQEDSRRAKILSAPTLIATDSIPASINVGDQVPTLTAQAVNGGIQQGGSSLFTQAVSNVQTGVTLNVLARVNPSGIVTMVINQDVSAPQAPAASSAIQSPSFSRRSVQTQVTVQDGDTIAIGGIMLETNTTSSSGIPLLHRIPGLGMAFGNKSISKQKTELVIFMTPRVIYDTNQIVEASDELKSGFDKMLNKVTREQW